MDQSAESKNWNDEARIACQSVLRCPQTWDRLTPTEDAGIRHCSECDRDVHLALSEEDFRRYGGEGKCVAVKVISTTSQMAYGVGYADVYPQS